MSCQFVQLLYFSMLFSSIPPGDYALIPFFVDSRMNYLFFSFFFFSFQDTFKKIPLEIFILDHSHPNATFLVSRRKEEQLLSAWEAGLSDVRVGTGSLENKQLFSLPSSDGNIGRGGDGTGRFVFAILDWTNELTGRRRRNYQRAVERHQAAGENIQPTQHLTQQRYEQLVIDDWINPVDREEDDLE